VYLRFDILARREEGVNLSQSVNGGRKEWLTHDVSKCLLSREPSGDAEQITQILRRQDILELATPQQSFDDLVLQGKLETAIQRYERNVDARFVTVSQRSATSSSVSSSKSSVKMTSEKHITGSRNADKAIIMN